MAETVKNLTEAEKINKKWKEELYRKDVNDRDNHSGVVSHSEPDILEYEIKWALGSTAINKNSGCNGISEVSVSSVHFSHSVVSDSLLPHEPQHARPPCPSPTPIVHPNPYPSS